MLILAFKIGEVFEIGPDLKIKVLEIYSKKGVREVRLGISAPQSVPIWRQEVWNEMQEKSRPLERK